MLLSIAKLYHDEPTSVRWGDVPSEDFHSATWHSVYDLFNFDHELEDSVESSVYSPVMLQ